MNISSITFKVIVPSASKVMFQRGFVNASTNTGILKRFFSLGTSKAGQRMFSRSPSVVNFQNYSSASLIFKRNSLPSSLNYNEAINQVRSVHTSAGGGSNSDEDKVMTLPPLMQFPNVMWPKFINTIRNWFFTYFVIKPYFDNDFSMQEFIQGAHEAVCLVSAKLSAGEFDDLEGLVEPSVLSELKQKVSTFSVLQQNLLKVAVEDVFFSFPYQIGIIIPDGPSPVENERYIESGQKPPPQVRHVEITVVLHVLRGMAEMQQRGDTGSSFNLVDFTKDESNKHKVMICNYRFFRDFTQGCKDPSWIINMVNHFLPAELNKR